jgi:arylsulfatase A-like enzyme
MNKKLLFSLIWSLIIGPLHGLNVVLFLVDDLGQRDLGCYGSTFYETPSIDRLAKQGARFTDAYAACPVCSPSRAAVFTGQWPQRSGVTDYIGGESNPLNWKRNTILRPATYADRLPFDRPTIASALKNKGYATFFAGKWHLGPESHWPEHHGFDINRGGHSGGGPGGKKAYFSPYNNPRLTDGPDGEHLTDRLANETIRFIEEHKSQPFFACYSFYDVHTPLSAREDLRKKYSEKRQRLALQDQWSREGQRDVRLTQDHVVYAAMVEAMDQAVGKVLAKIDELNLSEKTLILFTSDNGGLSTSEGWPTSNLPLRGGKGWGYEGGIRVPLIVRWPGITKADSVTSTPASGIDIFPTILDAANGVISSEQNIDGISIKKLLDAKENAVRPLFWHYPHYGNQGGAPFAAIRSGDWKLIHWFEDNSLELYNLKYDPSEKTNLAAKEKQRTDDLKNQLNDWQKSVNAKFPTANPLYNPKKPSGKSAKRTP